VVRQPAAGGIAVTGSPVAACAHVEHAGRAAAAYTPVFLSLLPGRFPLIHIVQGVQGSWLQQYKVPCVCSSVCGL